MKRILVTGGADAIGSKLARKLAEIGAEKVIILNDLSASYEWNIPNLPNVLFVKGSITSDIDLKRVFCEKPTYIFHLAAFFANQNSVDYPETSADVDIKGRKSGDEVILLQLDAERTALYNDFYNTTD